MIAEALKEIKLSEATALASTDDLYCRTARPPVDANLTAPNLTDPKAQTDGCTVATVVRCVALPHTL